MCRTPNVLGATPLTDCLVCQQHYARYLLYLTEGLLCDGPDMPGSLCRVSCRLGVIMQVDRGTGVIQ